jgi:nitrite reductase (NADH) small subunit
VTAIDRTGARLTHTIARAEDFPPGTRMRVEVGRRAVAVFNIDGRYWAIEDRCPHQFAPLSRGRLQGTVVCGEDTGWELEWAHEGEVVVCPGHGMEFDVTTGRSFGFDLRMRTYEVVVTDGEVRLRM